MNQPIEPTGPKSTGSPTRRNVLTAGAAFAALSANPAAAFAAPRILRGLQDQREIRVGLVGCGGRGTGAARQALRTAGPVRLVAMADAFSDRLNGALGHLSNPDLGVADRIDVPESRRFVGFDAYQRLLGEDLDMVILATPPHFRPDQFEAAVAADKHVFMEKPVAVDGAGVRKVLAAGRSAESKGLAVGVGLQRHHQNGYREAFKRVLEEGAIGDIVAAHCYWNMGGLWMNRREEAWSDMEWQMRNWLYFTWLSGDHIVEQHIHNLDVINWAKGGFPVRCHGMGGRQVRTDAAYGHIFDHHAVAFEYEDGTQAFSQCRQIDGCSNRVSEHLIGTKGRADLDSGSWRISGAMNWSHDGPNNDPYQTEHDDLFASIRAGKPYNEANQGAMSTLTAIMGRVASYTGQNITREGVLNDEARLGPEAYAWGSLGVDAIPMPGRG
jgi:myo-inositol 2-dehydrogenase / D-chiro-inositol 1-dehydrogenase